MQLNCLVKWRGESVNRNRSIAPRKAFRVSPAGSEGEQMGTAALGDRESDRWSSRFSVSSEVPDTLKRELQGSTEPTARN
jgi:hypothetical protein